MSLKTIYLLSILLSIQTSKDTTLDVCLGRAGMQKMATIWFLPLRSQRFGSIEKPVHS